MRVYSETIFSFIDKCEKMVKDILSKECELVVRRRRFEHGRHLYPIDVVVFEGKNLGYFDPKHYQIGLNRALVFNAKDSVLKDIIRHELAHYLVMIKHGEGSLPHGQEFQQVCESYGWPKEVSAASVNIELANETEGDLASEKILRKVKNLLKLAESSNPHESELATLKANQLLLKHNIEYTNVSNDEYLYVKKLLVTKRKDAKLCAIYEILRHFMVKPILSYAKGEVSIEATGTKTNIELAEYVAGFLDHELERLWTKYKNEHELKGLRAKNSFYYGLSKGYESKIKKARDSFSIDETTALTIIETNLDNQVQRIYNRLSSASSSSSRDHNSYSLGQKAGRSLNINQGVKSGASALFLT